MRDGPEPSRREILWTGSVAVGLLAPAWVRRGFAQDRAAEAAAPAAPEGAPVAPVPEVFAAFRRARRLGKPLLVLLIPSDPDERDHLGDLWGQVLNHGGDDALGLFALCEVVCAPAMGLHGLLPNFVIPGSDGSLETLAVLVETSHVAARATAVRATVPRVPTFGARVVDSTIAPEDELIDARIAQSTEALRAVIAASDAVLEMRARAARRRLGRAEHDRVVAALRAGRPVAPELADRAAAVIALEATRAPTPALRAHATRTLAAAAAHRLVDRPPPGSATRWGRAAGCGTTWERTDEDRARQRARVVRIDGRVVFRLEDVVVMGCGMGHVPERSQRFLDFYAAARSRCGAGVPPFECP